MTVSRSTIIDMMAKNTIIKSVADLGDYVDVELGVSDWVEITQNRIDAFADATGDHQWIHCDPPRADRESPYGGTIAHGYLTISLAPTLLGQIITIEDLKTAVNTGSDKVRLSAPVPVGARIRLSARIKDARGLPTGGVRVTLALRFEIEGVAKPACLANVNYVYFN